MKPYETPRKNQTKVRSADELIVRLLRELGLRSLVMKRSLISRQVQVRERLSVLDAATRVFSTPIWLARAQGVSATSAVMSPALLVPRMLPHRRCIVDGERWRTGREKPQTCGIHGRGAHNQGRSGVSRRKGPAVASI